MNKEETFERLKIDFLELIDIYAESEICLQEFAVFMITNSAQILALGGVSKKETLILIDAAVNLGLSWGVDVSKKYDAGTND